MRDNKGNGKVTLYKAVCDKCGKDCKVPFKPTGNKPIFCSDCFEGNSAPRGRSNDKFGRRNDRNRFSDKKTYSAICDQCGDRCELPFKPSSDKPIYCSKCFGEHKSAGGVDQETKEQINELNRKLDLILETLQEINTPKKVVRSYKLNKEDIDASTEQSNADKFGPQTKDKQK